MIKYFCDVCGDEITDDNICSTSRVVSHAATFLVPDIDKACKIKVFFGQEGNTNEVCIKCLRKIIGKDTCIKYT